MAVEETIPCDFILIRHGESEGNVADSFSNLEIDEFQQKIKDKNSFQYRLTEEGKKQAKITGDWIKKNIFETFDFYFSSDYLRTQETAGLLDFKDAEWTLKTDIREQILPFENETLDQNPTLLRSIGIENFLDEVKKLGHDKKVITVCHATTIRSFMIRIENLKYKDIFTLERNPDMKVSNCQIIWYSRRNPYDGSLSSHWIWKRMIVAYLDASGTRSFPWKNVQPKKYSSLQLLKFVDTTSPLLITETKKELDEKRKKRKESKPIQSKLETFFI